MKKTLEKLNLGIKDVLSVEELKAIRGGIDRTEPMPCHVTDARTGTMYFCYCYDQKHAVNCIEGGVA